MTPPSKNSCLTSPPQPHLGIIGGTGLYRLPGAQILSSIEVATPFGVPSGPVVVAHLPGTGNEGPTVAFLSRHGQERADGIELMVGDVADPGTVASALAGGVDVVVHQSAKVGLGVDYADAPAYVRNNDFATAVVLAGMASSGVDRLVLASSMVVYGEGSYSDDAGATVRPGPRLATDLTQGLFEPRHPVTGAALMPALSTEEDALDPRNVYAASKVAQEHLTFAWARATAGRAVVLRYHNVYGPGMPKDTPYAGVASLFRSTLARGEVPQLFEDGGQRRSFVHVWHHHPANHCGQGHTEPRKCTNIRHPLARRSRPFADIPLGVHTEATRPADAIDRADTCALPMPRSGPVRSGAHHDDRATKRRSS